MNKQQTAVDWFEQQLDDLNIEIPYKIWRQAQEMEKEQHKNTWFDSTAQFDNSAEMTYKKEFEQYFNETYGKS